MVKIVTIFVKRNKTYLKRDLNGNKTTENIIVRKSHGFHFDQFVENDNLFNYTPIDNFIKNVCFNIFDEEYIEKFFRLNNIFVEDENMTLSYVCELKKGIFSDFYNYMFRNGEFCNISYEKYKISEVFLDSSVSDDIKNIINENSYGNSKSIGKKLM